MEGLNRNEHFEAYVPELPVDLLKELTVSSAKKSRFGKGKREFLVLKEEIRAAISAGYSVKEIWGYLHEKGLISIGYEYFSEYVRRYGLRQIVAVPEPNHKPEIKPK